MPFLDTKRGRDTSSRPPVFWSASGATLAAGSPDVNVPSGSRPSRLRRRPAHDQPRGQDHVPRPAPAVLQTLEQQPDPGRPELAPGLVDRREVDVAEGGEGRVVV